MGVFSGAVLTCATSGVGYLVERRHTLEAFHHRTLVILKYLRTYETDWDTEKKVRFFLEYHRVDKSEWDMAFGDIAFLWNPLGAKKKALWKNIYGPINELNHAVARHEYHFEKQIKYIEEGLAGNERVMRDFIAEIEPLFMTERTSITPGDGCVPIDVAPYNWLVQDVESALNSNEYFTYTYGRRTARRVERLRDGC